MKERYNHMDPLIVEYEDTLIDKLQHVDLCNFYEPGSAINERMALGVIKYVIEDVLRWTPDDAVQKFDSYMIKLMKLNKFVNYIEYPIEVSKGDTRYILSLLYPNKIELNSQQLVEETYKNVLDNDNSKQFPREYFIGGAGFQRFCICFKYLIENIKPFNNIKSMYDYFNSAEGKRLLGQYRLKVPADQFFININDVLHYITRNESESDFWYAYYTFLLNYPKVKD